MWKVMMATYRDKKEKWWDIGWGLTALLSVGVLFFVVTRALMNTGGP